MQNVFAGLCMALIVHCVDSVVHVNLEEGAEKLLGNGTYTSQNLSMFDARDGLANYTLPSQNLPTLATPAPDANDIGHLLHQEFLEMQRMLRGVMDLVYSGAAARISSWQARNASDIKNVSADRLHAGTEAITRYSFLSGRRTSLRIMVYGFLLQVLVFIGLTMWLRINRAAFTSLSPISIDNGPMPLCPGSPLTWSSCDGKFP